MFIYQQSTGRISHDGVDLGIGYAGNGEWLNEPWAQNIKKHGPLPQGYYTIGPPHVHDHLGPITMALTPDPENEMYGRRDFFMHGVHENDHQDSSDGCIAANKVIRNTVGAQVLAGNNRLQVIA